MGMVKSLDLKTLLGTCPAHLLTVLCRHLREPSIMRALCLLKQVSISLGPPSAYVQDPQAMLRMPQVDQAWS